jgi:flagellin-like hook-associated protein FlgL
VRLLSNRHLFWLLPIVLAPGFCIGPASLASASTGAAEVRVAHLSPETGGADVWVTPVGGTQTEFAHDVTYGETTKYTSVPAGTYAVSMHPTGVTTGKPLLAGNLTLAAGGVYTVVVTGPTDHLVDRVLDDELGPPPTGQSKVRIIQGSTTAGSPTIKAVPQPTLARHLAYAAVTGYGVVPHGTWRIRISTEPNLHPTVTLAPNTVYTLLVLNGPNHSVTVRTTIDAIPAAPAPPSAPTPLTTSTTASTAATLPFSSSSYAVKSGDNLWDISNQVLTSAQGHTPTDQQVATYVMGLIAANKSQLTNPNLIYPGQSLVLPPT